MAFTLRRRSSLPREAAWAAVTDFQAHTSHVPLTAVTTDAGEPHVGWKLVGVTRLGPVAFADPMFLTVWEPPHRFRLVKTGWLLAGWADVLVEPDGTGSTVTWTEEITLRAGPAGRLTTRIGDLAGPRLFGRVVDGLLREAQARRR